MASRGKKKTTMAKLTRESRLRERRSEKVARKNARKSAAAAELNGELIGEEGESLDEFGVPHPAPDAEATADAVREPGEDQLRAPAEEQLRDPGEESPGR